MCVVSGEFSTTCLCLSNRNINTHTHTQSGGELLWHLPLSLNAILRRLFCGFVLLPLAQSFCLLFFGGGFLLFQSDPPPECCPAPRFFLFLHKLLGFWIFAGCWWRPRWPAFQVHPKKWRIWRNVACWYFIWLSNSHCGRLRKSQTDVSRWFGGTMTKQSDTEHNNTTRRPSALKFLCDVWSSVALSKPVATVCPAQRRLYVCVGYTVVHKLSLSLSPILSYCVVVHLFAFDGNVALFSFLFSLFLFSLPPPGTHGKVGKRERHTLTKCVEEEGRREKEKRRLTTHHPIPRCVCVCVYRYTPRLPGLPWGAIFLAPANLNGPSSSGEKKKKRIQYGTE